MSADRAASAVVATSLPPPTREPRARFRDLFAAEWTKLWSLRSSYGSLALIMLAAVCFSANAALADHRNWPDYSADRRALFNPLRDAFPEQAYLFVMLAAGSIGAITIVGEYGSGLIRTTFAAVPDRRLVVAAKIAVVTSVLTVVGAVAAASSFGVSQAILSGRQADSPITDPGVLPALLASTLLVPLAAIVGMGIGALVRHTAPSIVGTAVVLLLLPTAFTESSRWQAIVNHALPLSAWQHLVDPGPAAAWVQQPYPATTSGAWIVYAVWPLVAAIVAVVVVHRREP